MEVDGMSENQRMSNYHTRMITIQDWLVAKDRWHNVFDWVMLLISSILSNSSHVLRNGYIPIMHAEMSNFNRFGS